MEALDLLLEKAGYLDKEFYVLGHSMGAFCLAPPICIASRSGRLFCFANDSTACPACLVTRLLAKLLIQLGFRRKLIPFSRMTPMIQARRFRLDNVLTRYPEGYDRQYQIFEKQPDLRRYRPSVGWVQAAFEACLATSLNPDWMAEIECPVLALLAEDERVINLPRARQMLAICQTVGNIICQYPP